MNVNDWISLAATLYEKGGKKTYHVNDLTQLAIEFGLIPIGETEETFVKKMSQKLLANSSTKSPQFARVKSSKTKKHRRGFYRIIVEKPVTFHAPAPDVSTNYTGAGGEYAVLSELLFRGFNASKMTVDDGIDVVASKNSSYFHVQVKTANERAGKFQATIRTSAFQHSATVFYVVVLRQNTPTRYVNDYVIFASGDIRKWILKGELKESSSINLRLSHTGKRLMLNDTIDITVHKNNWDFIC